MKSWMGKVALSAVAVGAMVAATTPAEARPYGRGYYGGHGGYSHHYRGYRGDRAGLAIGAGILGLAVGSALASRDRGGYYGGGYGYSYAPPPRYYAPGPYYSDYGRCWWDREWDGYGWRRVRVCD